MLKFIIAILVEKYGAYYINDALADLFNSRIKYGSDNPKDYERNRFNDELSEAYDAINARFFRFRRNN